MGREISIGPTGTAVLLAYISGFVDTLSFIALFGLFAAHITGNFVLIATSLAEMHHGLWMKLLAVPVFIAAAMAIQNAASRTFFSALPPTTVMTGNLMQIIVDTVDLMQGHEPLDAKRARIAKLVPMLFAFIAGTLCGAIGYTIAGFLSLVAPIVTVSALAVFGKSSPQQVHA